MTMIHFDDHDVPLLRECLASWRGQRMSAVARLDEKREANDGALPAGEAMDCELWRHQIVQLNRLLAAIP